MYSLKGFEPREYQKSIFRNSRKNTLICLPTGTGKTKIAILLLIERLNQFSDSKALIMSPTKPLSSQIAEETRECTDIPPALITLLTGAIKPIERKKLFSAAKVIVATPQTIEKDIAKGRISLKDVSLLVVDECHRSKERFANTIVAKHYKENADNQKIIALTASPGSTKEKIQEVCSNLFIENIEIRTRDDSDIIEYIQKKPINYIDIDLTNELKSAKELIESQYKKTLLNLKKFGLTKPSSLINKKDLLVFQNHLRIEINKRNMSAFAGISQVAQALKLSYILELIETQTISSAYSFLEKLENEPTKAAKIITNNEEVIMAKGILKELVKNGVEHPKLTRLKEILKNDLELDKETKIIIFANYRDTVDSIVKGIENDKIKPIKLVGQKGGITQKKQIETTKKFEEGIYNVLVATSIGEEGLDIGGKATHAIFYDAVPSEIRAIQRAGRVGRTMEGKITMLLTKSSRDQAYFWSSKRKESVMKKTLYNLQNKGEHQVSLNKNHDGNK